MGRSVGAVHVASCGWRTPATRVHGARHAARSDWSWPLCVVRGDVAQPGGIGRSRFGRFLVLLLAPERFGRLDDVPQTVWFLLGFQPINRHWVPFRAGFGDFLEPPFGRGSLRFVLYHSLDLGYFWRPRHRHFLRRGALRRSFVCGFYCRILVREAPWITPMEF